MLAHAQQVFAVVLETILAQTRTSTDDIVGCCASASDVEPDNPFHRKVPESSENPVGSEWVAADESLAWALSIVVLMQRLLLRTLKSCWWCGSAT